LLQQFGGKARRLEQSFQRAGVGVSLKRWLRFSDLVATARGLFMKQTRTTVLLISALSIATTCFSQNGGNFFGGINYAAGITPQEVFDEIGGKGLGYNPGFEPVQAQVGDFNNDGKLDIVLAGGCTTTFSPLCTNGSAIAVYLGNGDGTFQTPPIVAAGISSTLRAIYVADFNGDGNLDVIAENDEQASCNYSCGTVTVLLGNGSGRLSIAAVYDLAGQIDYSTLTAFASGDFNGDGKLDLAVSTDCSTQSCKSGDSIVQVFLGNGDGTFGSPALYDAGAYPGPSPVASADFNGDGKTDLLLSHLSAPGGDRYHSSISLLLGKGDGTFQPPTTTPLSFGGAQALAAGDFNVDGKMDLAISANSSVNILLGNGDGTFQAPATYYVSTYYPSSLVVADFNGDGKPDIASGGGQGSGANLATILLNNGDGSFQVGPNYSLGGTDLASVVTGDFNGDGKTDIALSSLCMENTIDHCPDGNISLLLGNGDGTMQAAGPANLTVNPHHLILADLNGDGIEDMVGTQDCYQNNCQNQQGGVVVALGLGNGTFGAATEYPTGAGTSHPSGIAVGDFNGDGKLDVIVDGYGVSVLLGNGDGSLRTPVVYPTAQYVTGPPGIGDFAGNAKLGVAVLHQEGGTNNNATVGILMGNGDGTLQSEVVTQASEITGYQLTVGDFNHDGKADVAAIGTAIALPQYSAITVFLGNGDGTLTVKPDPYTNPPDDYLIVCNGNICVPLASYPTYGSVGTYLAGASITNADVNADGNLDLVASSACVINDRSCSTGMIAGCGGMGDGTFFCGVVGHMPLPDANYLGVAVKDINGDGKPDIIATTLTGIAVYLNGDHGGTVYAGANLNGAEIPAVADVNGDGAPDIAVSDGNGVTILFNRGGFLSATTTILNSSNNPSAYGARVTFTATVTSANGTPTGTVTFMDGSTPLAKRTLTNGAAKFTISTLAVGTHPMTAVYSGSPDYQGSTSAPLGQVVNQAQTAMTLHSAPNPSVHGQLVTFTAKLTSNGGVPTGKVAFSFGTTKVFANINKGKAVFATKVLPMGKTKVKAAYAGNADYSAASATVTQQVN
jgi:hypothetical protein